MRQDWSDEELAASVAAYQTMALYEASGEPYSKTEIYRELVARFGRTKGAFEFRMQNISAVLDGMGRDWITGLKPASNVGPNVQSRIVALIEGTPPVHKPSRRSEAPYRAKLPAIRSWLIHVARSRNMVAYSDVMEVFGIDRFSLRHAMDALGHQAKDLGEPIITALIVGKNTRTCSVGIATEFGIEDDALERARLYNYWQATTDNNESSEEGIQARAARFASVEVRPDQAKFRRVVFVAYGGQCAISGCDVIKALDAAHLHGRLWRAGQNSAGDGVLLRKDLHALYDSKLLSIDAQGKVTLDTTIQPHYGAYEGAQITMKPK